MIPVGHRPIARVLVKRSELSVDQSYEKMVSLLSSPPPNSLAIFETEYSVSSRSNLDPPPYATLVPKPWLKANSVTTWQTLRLFFFPPSRFSHLFQLPITFGLIPFRESYSLVDERHFVVTTSPLSIYSGIVSRNENEIAILGEKQFFNRMNFLLEG